MSMACWHTSSPNKPARDSVLGGLSLCLNSEGICVIIRWTSLSGVLSVSPHY